jgi:colicin import membrane protein
MNKLLIALTAGAFALGSVAVLADDKTPAAPVDQAKMKAEKDAAKAAAAKMTPEEKAAAKKAKRAAKQKEVAQIEKVGNIPGGPQKAEAIKKSADATKNDPKALPTAADKQKALKEQEKKASGQ